MPISSKIATAANGFHQNATFLKQAIDGLTDEEWVRRPNEHTNHMQWIVCHVAWARTNLLKRLGAEWTTPWISLYGRGAKCVDSPDCPSPKAALEAWNETCTRLTAALDSVTDESLDVPVTQGPPTADGKLSGVIHFLAYHETYHVGQAAYVRCWLGHSRVMG
jgi:uncharacterized damage-inducible protein DinB